MRYIGRKIVKMKNLKTAICICVLIFVASCSKNKNDDGTVEPNVANLQSSGDSANDLLSNSNFTKLQIQLAYSKGFRPTATAINALVDFLKTHTFKTDIELIYKELPLTGENELSLQEVADLETENRTVYNEDDTLGIYIYFTDAAASSDGSNNGSVTLGGVYRNTSMVIYEPTVQIISNQSSSITVADVETATLSHEFGHLLGLVNLGTPMVNPHEESSALNHCNQIGCLMRAEIQLGTTNRSASFIASDDSIGLKSSCSLDGRSILKMLKSNQAKGISNVSTLDPFCISDLQNNGGR